MKVLLVGINAKFVQTNLAIRLLRSFAQSHCKAAKNGLIQIEIAEWNINLPVPTAVRGIFERGPDMVLFSTYIWNREFTLQVCAEIRMLLPGILIGLGGPEVSWSAEKTFKECAAADFILAEEGEQTFADLVDRLAGSREFSGISGTLLENRRASRVRGGTTRSFRLIADSFSIRNRRARFRSGKQNRVLRIEQRLPVPVRILPVLNR